MASTDRGRGGPEHVAIIMDGNGRWAARRGLPRLRGHREGAERLREIVENCPRLGIKVLTVFAFSTENWKRSSDEVQGLMTLLQLYTRSEAAALAHKGVRVRFIGNRDGLGPRTVKEIERLEALTSNCETLQLIVAVNYGGRAELVEAARQLCRQALEGEIGIEDVCEEVLDSFTFTSDVPDPDLIIRTSGEFRLSNFLLWQSAFAELEFVDTLWPDFSAGQLEDVLSRYSNRERRFGATGQ